MYVDVDLEVAVGKNIMPPSPFYFTLMAFRSRFGSFECGSRCRFYPPNNSFRSSSVRLGSFLWSVYRRLHKTKIRNQERMATNGQIVKVRSKPSSNGADSNVAGAVAPSCSSLDDLNLTKPRQQYEMDNETIHSNNITLNAPNIILTSKYITIFASLLQNGSLLRSCSV